MNFQHRISIGNFHTTMFLSCQSCCRIYWWKYSTSTVMAIPCAIASFTYHIIVFTSADAGTSTRNWHECMDHMTGKWSTQASELYSQLTQNTQLTRYLPWRLSHSPDTLYRLDVNLHMGVQRFSLICHSRPCAVDAVIPMKDRPSLRKKHCTQPVSSCSSVPKNCLKW